MPPLAHHQKTGRSGDVCPQVPVLLRLLLVAASISLMLVLYTWSLHSAEHGALVDKLARLQSALEDHAREEQHSQQEGEKHVHGHILGLQGAIARLEENAARHQLRGDAQPRPPPPPPPPPVESLQLSAGEPLDLPPMMHTRGEAPSTLLLVVASNRPQYLQRCLASVVQHHPRKDVPVLVSEDGNEAAVRLVVDEARTAFLAQLPAEIKENEKAHLEMLHVHFAPPAGSYYENGYFRLAAHYKWALTQAFAADVAIQRVIVLEEDLQVAPDFFALFVALAPLLDDPRERLLCVSAFNDNGQAGHVRDAKQLYRSDFFPGLGWMLTRALWAELEPKWPRAYWDDWLREPRNRLGRQVIRPEVSRTFHFGRVGVSNSQFGDFLGGIALQSGSVQFSQLDLGYLSKATWDVNYMAAVQRAALVSPTELPAIVQHARPGDTEGPNRYPDGVRVHYGSFDEFVRLASTAQLMDNIKANVPRTAYRGVVSAWLGGCIKLHIAPTPAFALHLDSL